MALQPPVPGATLTQKFGVSNMSVEPAMFASASRAYWQWFSGSTFHNDFHPAIDLAAAAGTHIVASEAGRVVESYFDNKNGGGNKVTVEIRPNVRYTSNHMASRWVTAGVTVKRGQTLGTVDSTGWSTGNHNHFQVTIRETDATGVSRTFMYNPQLFFSGGAMAGDPRITPIYVPPSGQYVALNGAGINIRSTPNLDVGSSNVYATSNTHGIYRNGNKIAELNHKMKFGGWVSNDDGVWAKAYLQNAYRYVKKELIHFA